MKSCTIDQVISYGPCLPEYTKERVTELFGKRKTLTALQILNLKIPIPDRFWAVLRENLIDAQILRLAACAFAERALRQERSAKREPDKRSWEAIRMARLYAYGKVNKEELTAAWSAARSAAKSAAWSAARSAAKSAAESAAWSAEYRWQLKTLKKMLTSLPLFPKKEGTRPWPRI
jgi:hypothetical protein